MLPLTTMPAPMPVGCRHAQVPVSEVESEHESRQRQEPQPGAAALALPLEPLLRLELAHDRADRGRREAGCPRQLRLTERSLLLQHREDPLAVRPPKVLGRPGIRAHRARSRSSLIRSLAKPAQIASGLEFT